MAKVLCLIAMFVVTFGVVHSHTYHAGSCPTVEPMSGFNMKQVIHAYQEVFIIVFQLVDYERNISNKFEYIRWFYPLASCRLLYISIEPRYVQESRGDIRGLSCPT